MTNKQLTKRVAKNVAINRLIIDGMDRATRAGLTKQYDIAIAIKHQILKHFNITWKPGHSAKDLLKGE